MRQVRLISAGGQFVRDVRHVCPPFAERSIHLLQTFEIRMTVSACIITIERPRLRSQAIVKLQYDLKNIDQAHAHLFSARVEHTSEIDTL